METTTTSRPVPEIAAPENTALPEFDIDLTGDLAFARRSVRYMLNNRCDASEIIDTLTIDLGVNIDTAHELLSETTALVAA
jgi:hypothetical protein